MCIIEAHDHLWIRLTLESRACYEYLVGACITAKMTITIGLSLLIVFSLTRLSSGHELAPNRPKLSESSTAHVCMHAGYLPRNDLQFILQIARVVPHSPNTQVHPTSYYMEKQILWPSAVSINHFYSTWPDLLDLHVPYIISDHSIIMFRTLSTHYGSGNMLYAYQMGKNAAYGTGNYLIRDDLGTCFQYFE